MPRVDERSDVSALCPLPRRPLAAFWDARPEQASCSPEAVSWMVVDDNNLR
jgi:hypothetical protein